MDGSCVAVGCPDATQECGGVCVDTRQSVDHCGGCDAPCVDAARNSRAAACVDGQCGCALESRAGPVPGAVCDGWCHLTGFDNCEGGCCPPLFDMNVVPGGEANHFIHEVDAPSILRVDVRCGRGRGRLIRYLEDGQLLPMTDLACGEGVVVRGADVGHYGLSFTAERGDAEIGLSTQALPVDFDVPGEATRRAADDTVEFVFRVPERGRYHLDFGPDGFCNGRARVHLFNHGGLLAVIADLDQCFLSDIDWRGVLDAGIYTLTLSAAFLPDEYTLRLRRAEMP